MRCGVPDTAESCVLTWGGVVPSLKSKTEQHTTPPPADDGGSGAGWEEVEALNEDRAARRRAAPPSPEGLAGGEQPAACAAGDLVEVGPGVWEVMTRYLSLEKIAASGCAGNTVTIQSPQGTGKTELMAAMVKHLIEQGLRILVLTHRQSLGAQLSERVEGVNYQESKGNLVIDRGSALVICLDSIGRLSLRDGRESIAPDIVIIDESEQVTRHLFGATIADRLDVIAEDLREIVGKAQHVLCADADAGPLTKALLKYARGTEGIKIINKWAEWTFSPNAEVEVLKDQTSEGLRKLMTAIAAEALDMVQASAEAAKRLGPVMVGCVSCSKATLTACHVANVLNSLSDQPPPFALTDEEKRDKKNKKIRKIKSNDPFFKKLTENGVLLVTSKTKDTKEVRAWLRKPNEETPKYLVVIYSPTAGTGVSIDCPVRRLFLMGNAVRGFTGPDIVQLMTRARTQMKVPLVWLSERTFDDLPATWDEAQEQVCRRLAQSTDSVKGVYLNNKRMLERISELKEQPHAADDLVNFWAETQIETGRTGRDPARVALALLEKRGAKVRMVSGPNSLEKEDVDEIKECLDAHEVQAVLDAERLPAGTDLKKLREIGDPKIHAQVIRAEIEKRLCEDVTYETAHAAVVDHALPAGWMLAKAAVLTRGGEASDYLKRNLADHLTRRPILVLVDPSDKEVTRAEAARVILGVAGLGCVFEGTAPPGTLDDLSMETLFMWACDHRIWLSDQGFTPPKVDTHPDRVCGETLRWLKRVLKALGMKCEVRRASGSTRRRKTGKQWRHCLTQAAVSEAWRWAKRPFAELLDAAERDQAGWPCAA